MIISIFVILASITYVAQTQPDHSKPTTKELVIKEREIRENGRMNRAR